MGEMVRFEASPECCWARQLTVPPSTTPGARVAVWFENPLTVDRVCEKKDRKKEAMQQRYLHV